MNTIALREAAARFRRAPASPTAAPHRVRGRARLALALLPPAFVAVLLAAWTGAEAAVPEITDTDYYVRLNVVRTAAAEHPDRPLGVVLGSSRMVWAFQPELLTESDGTYWVNGAHVGAGPTLNRVILHRLLRDGVKPAVVALEVMPAFFVGENSRFVCGHFAVAELPLMRSYSDKPLGYDYHFLRHRVGRAGDIARAAAPLAGRPRLHPRGGWAALEDDVSDDERATRTAAALKANGEFLRRMTVRPGADRAFRDTLREAADHGVRVVLLRSPEGPTFRSWYDPEGLKRFDAYIARVASEHGVPVIDAREWLDEDDFYDSHHALKRGAGKFTARFAREFAALSDR